MYSPNEVLAMTAESWMFEEARNKFMIFNLRYILLLQGPLPSPANRHLLVYTTTIKRLIVIKQMIIIVSFQL